MTDEKIFKDGLSDIHNSEIPEPRDLEAELFNKRTIKDLVTNLEQELGLSPGKKNSVIKKRHAVVLAPSREEDGAKLSLILNDDKTYNIVMWKDTWTVHGDYRVFLIYEEFLDDKGKK